MASGRSPSSRSVYDCTRSTSANNANRSPIMRKHSSTLGVMTGSGACGPDRRCHGVAALDFAQPGVASLFELDDALQNRGDGRRLRVSH